MTKQPDEDGVLVFRIDRLPSSTGSRTNRYACAGPFNAAPQRVAIATLLTSNIVDSARSSLKDDLVLARQPGPTGT